MRIISTGSPQDLPTGACTKSCRTPGISAGPLQELFIRASTRACKGLLTAFQRDLHEVFAQGLVKDLGQDLHAGAPPKIHRIILKGHAAGADLTRS